MASECTPLLAFCSLLEPDTIRECQAGFFEERDRRLGVHPEADEQFMFELEGEFGRYEEDPYAGPVEYRDPFTDTVQVVLVGGGFAGLLVSFRLRAGIESIRLVERGADVGGTWYWNRYPGIACDVISYDYLPLL